MLYNTGRTINEIPPSEREEAFVLMGHLDRIERVLHRAIPFPLRTKVVFIGEPIQLIEWRIYLHLEGWGSEQKFGMSVNVNERELSKVAYQEHLYRQVSLQVTNIVWQNSMTEPEAMHSPTEPDASPLP